jgi:signal transduction protein with GAF and PtsI domain
VSQPTNGHEIVVEPADLITVYTEKNHELSQQVAMLIAANRRLQRQIAEARDEPAAPTNGAVVDRGVSKVEVPHGSPR